MLSILQSAHHFIYTASRTHKEKTMTRPTRVEVNCTTGETSIIELTDAEIAQMEADAAAAETQRKADEKAAADKAVARTQILDRLGLTADEAAILLG